jgi:hypothetical protein
VISTLSAAPISVAFGTPLAQLTATLTYTGTIALGSAVFFSVDGGTMVVSTCTGSGSRPETCSATYAVGTLGSRTHAILVTEAADASYAAASTSGTLTVQPASGTVVITAVSSSAAQGNGSRGLSIKLSNTGTGSAQFFTLTGLTVAGIACTPIPQAFGMLEPGRSANAVCTIPASAGTACTTAVEKILGTHQGGTFSGTYRLTLP